MYVIKYKNSGLVREVSIRTSRKERRCSMCGKKIAKGEKYIRLSMGNLCTKEFVNYYLCFDCWSYIKKNIKKYKMMMPRTAER